MANPADSLESVVIGDGVVVKGAFTVPSKAVINGVIEGDLTAEEVLIGTTGRIIAAAKCRTARQGLAIGDARGEVGDLLADGHAGDPQVAPCAEVAPHAERSPQSGADGSHGLGKCLGAGGQ